MIKSNRAHRPAHGVFHMTAGSLTEVPSISRIGQQMLRNASQDESLDATAILAKQRTHQELVRNAIRTGAEEPQFG